MKTLIEIDKVSQYFIDRKMKFIERYLGENLIGGGKSLDIGCNHGSFSEMLAGLGFNS